MASNISAEQQLITQIQEATEQTYRISIIVCTSLQILFIIMFLCKIKQKHSSFSSAYCIFLIFEYIINSVMFIFWYIYLFDEVGLLYPMRLIIWYQWRFYAFCNTVLALNRLTGILFWQLHARLWKGWRLKVIICLTLAYPFILHGYPFAYCHISKEPNACDDFRTSQLVTYSNIVNAGAALFFGLVTVFSRKLKLNALQTKQSYEIPLLFQSVITSAFLVIYEILRIISSNYVETMQTTGKFNVFNFEIFLTANLLTTSTSIMFVISNFSSTLFLFIMSTPVRQSFLSFYRLDRVFCKNRNAQVADVSLFTVRRSDTSKVPVSP